MAKIIKTDPKRDWGAKPSTLEEKRLNKTEGRDWKRYPLTVSEIQGWTSALKKQQHQRAVEKHERRIKKPA